MFILFLSSKYSQLNEKEQTYKNTIYEETNDFEIQFRCIALEECVQKFMSMIFLFLLGHTKAHYFAICFLIIMVSIGLVCLHMCEQPVDRFECQTIDEQNNTEF